MSYWGGYNGDNWNDGEYGSKNRGVQPGIHIMNKNEKKALRKLKVKTGLSEVQIRKEKDFRRILSTAQKERGNRSHFETYLLNISKRVTREMKLPKEHPLVIYEMEKIFDDNHKNVHRTYYLDFQRIPNQELLNTINRLRKKQKNLVKGLFF